MKHNRIHAGILNCLLVSMILMVSNSCQLSRLEANPPETTKTDGAYAVPKTGQRVSHAAGDDGDLQKGAAWTAPRLIDNGDGTVTDNFSGLMWTQDADPAKGGREWEQALAGAAACKEGGYADWRLPNRRELESLMDLGRFNPALPADHPFNGVQSSYYWTSTTPANNEDHAWIIHFYIGFVSHDDKAGTHHVWYVRGGQ
jgi:hypothetical protein